MGPCGNIEAYYSRIGNTRSILDRPPIFVFLPRVRFLLASLLFRLVPLFSSSLVPPGSLVFSPAINFFITSTNFSVPPVASEIFSVFFKRDIIVHSFPCFVVSRILFVLS